MAAAERLQRNRLPTIAPLLDGWQLAGRSRQAGPLGGAFHDWFSLPKGLLAVAIGRAADAGIVGAINADAVMAALRSHAQHRRQAERILRDANMTLWTGSAGDRHVSGLLAVVDPASGRLRCSSAGRPVSRLAPCGRVEIGRARPPLGESPEAKFPQFACQLQPGEAAIWTDGSQDGLATVDRGPLEARLAEGLQPHLDLSADGFWPPPRKSLTAATPTTSSRDDRAGRRANAPPLDGRPYRGRLKTAGMAELADALG